MASMTECGDRLQLPVTIVPLEPCGAVAFA